MLLILVCAIIRLCIHFFCIVLTFFIQNVTIESSAEISYVTLEHKTSHKGLEIYIINNISIDVWHGQYLKIWNLRVQKNQNIEKIIFKVVFSNAYY